MQSRYHAVLSGIGVDYAFEYEDTARYMKPYLCADAVVADDAECISVGPTEWEDWAKLGSSKRNGFAEYSLIGCRTSEHLMHHNRFVFHAVALRFAGWAWLITAPPGIGKSTQYRHLHELYPEEVSIINGDKPIVELRGHDVPFVHPSPWMGKEKWGGAEGAPLAGIIYLRHGDNSIAPIDRKEVAARTFFSVFQLFETRESIRMAARMANALLQGTDTWLLTNRGDHESSQLIYQTMKEWMNRKP